MCLTLENRYQGLVPWVASSIRVCRLLRLASLDVSKDVVKAVSTCSSSRIDIEDSLDDATS